MRGTTLTVTGQPLAQFVFDFIPSWNEVIGKARAHWSVGSKHTKEWRADGFRLADAFMRAFHKDKKYLIGPIEKRALVIVWVYRATERTYDIHNVCLKAIADGFTDANIWPDDDWVYVPLVLFAWHYNPDADQRCEIEIHNLERFVVNGLAQVLPKGRRVVSREPVMEKQMSIYDSIIKEAFADF